MQQDIQKIQNDVVPLRKDQIPRTADLMARAFADDPTAAPLFPDETTRRDYMTRTFGPCIQYGLLYGRAFTTEDLAGVSVWVAPGKTKMTLWRLLRSGMLLTPMGLGLGAFRRFKQFGDFADRLHAKAMPGPHWYLFILAIEPDRQGQGIGRALVRAGLERADADCLPVYLETTNPKNVEIYQKLGFRLLGKYTEPTLRLDIWNLMREAPSGG